MLNITIRIGLGRSPSGKILDKNTRWFIDKDKAIEEWEKTHKPIFVSKGGKKKYEPMTIEQLRAL